MRAAAFSEFGGPEVLRLMELPDPEAGPGQVRIRVRAAGVQPIDCAVRRGFQQPGTTITFPAVPGNEFAGVIDQVGEGVSNLVVGAEVLGFGRLNASAELLAVAADQVVAKPSRMPWAIAGGFTAGAQTAHIALTELAIGPDDTLLVHGAAGAVGTVAVQLGVRAGARVIGTASESNQDYVRSLGATPLVYGADLVERVRALGGVTTALDGAGGAALAASLELVADRSRILTLVEHERASELGIRVTPNARSAARLAGLVALYDAGELAVHLRATLPLEQAADAHRLVETGHGAGKVVLTID